MAGRPETTAAAYARRGIAPVGAVEAAERARAEPRSQPGTNAAMTAMRDSLYYTARWYYDPKYTGYTFFGRWTKHEMLIDPDDVSAGQVTHSAAPRPGRRRFFGMAHLLHSLRPHDLGEPQGDRPQALAGPGDSGHSAY